MKREKLKVKGLRFWGGLGLVLAFVRCAKPAEQPTIPENEMARIMGDLIIADAATANFSGYQKDSLAQVYFKQVYDMHGVTLQTYEQNLRLYTKDLDKMERITKQVEERFNKSEK